MLQKIRLKETEERQLLCCWNIKEEEPSQPHDMIYFVIKGKVFSHATYHCLNLTVLKDWTGFMPLLQNAVEASFHWPWSKCLWLLQYGPIPRNFSGKELAHFKISLFSNLFMFCHPYPEENWFNWSLNPLQEPNSSVFIILYSFFS